VTAADAGGARAAAGSERPHTLIHRNNCSNPRRCYVSGPSYTLEAAWHLRAFEDGKEVGGAFFDGCPAGRVEAEEVGKLWLEFRGGADAGAT
jgi:hypothetical protein